LEEDVQYRRVVVPPLTITLDAPAKTVGERVEDEDLRGPFWVDFEFAKNYMRAHMGGWRYLKKKNAWFQFADFDTACAVAEDAISDTPLLANLGIFRSYGVQLSPVRIVERDVQGNPVMRNPMDHETCRTLRWNNAKNVNKINVDDRSKKAW